MNKFCAQCGNAITSEQKFCASCGKPVPQSENPTVETKKNEKAVSIPIFVKVLAYVMSIILAIVTVQVGTSAMGIDLTNTEKTHEENRNSLDGIVGIDFYNIDKIPCIETDEEFSSIYIPYILRGIAERYHNAQLMGDYIISDEFMDDHSFEEWCEAMGVYADEFEIIEGYAKEFERMLQDLESEEIHIVEETSRFELLDSIYTPMVVHAEFTDKQALLQAMDEGVEAHLKTGVDVVEYAAEKLGISAEKCKELGRQAEYQKTSIEANKKWEKVEEREKIKENVARTMVIAGKAATIYITTVTTGGSNLMMGAAFITNVDAAVSIGKEGCTIAFGADSKSTGFFTNLKGYTEPLAIGAGFLTLNVSNISSSSITNTLGTLADKGVKLSNYTGTFMKVYNAGSNIAFLEQQISEAGDGKFLKIDFNKKGEVLAETIEGKESISEVLEENGLNKGKYEMTDEEFKELSNDNSWMDASEEVKAAYLEKKKEAEEKAKNDSEEDFDKALGKMKESLNDKSSEKPSDGETSDNTKDSDSKTENQADTKNDKPDDNIEGMEKSDAEVEREKAAVEEKLLKEEENKNTKPADVSSEVAIEFFTRCAKRINYPTDDLMSPFSLGPLLAIIAKGGFEDLANEMGQGCPGMLEEIKQEWADMQMFEEEQPIEVIEALDKDPNLNAIWQRLESMNSVDDTIVDTLMSDIVWNIGAKQLNGEYLTLEEIRIIFKERSEDMYKQFSDLLEE